MTIVIADTSPLNYLILINAIQLLPELYGEVIIPSAVLEELRHPGAPETVRRWANQLPAWIKVKSPDSVLSHGTVLGRGETDAISLGSELTASLLLLDDRAARRIAAEKNLAVVGTIGILERAAEQDLIDLRTTLQRLLQTNFRLEAKAVTAALERLARKKNS